MLLNKNDDDYYYYYLGQIPQLSEINKKNILFGYGTIFIISQSLYYMSACVTVCVCSGDGCDHRRVASVLQCCWYTDFYRHVSVRRGCTALHKNAGKNM